MEKHFKTQLQRYFAYLKDNIATNSMVEQATGIHHKNLTRHKATLEKQGKIVVVHKGICKLTGFKADYLSTNEKEIQKNLNKRYLETLFPEEL